MDDHKISKDNKVAKGGAAAKKTQLYKHWVR